VTLAPVFIRVYGNEKLLLDEVILIAIRRIAADLLERQTADYSLVKLDPDLDIRLFTQVTSRRDGMSHMSEGLVVDIEAADSPFRVANRQELADALKDRISNHLPRRGSRRLAQDHRRQLVLTNKAFEPLSNRQESAQ
jgi:hypothetical protein